MQRANVHALITDLAGTEVRVEGTGDRDGDTEAQQHRARRPVAVTEVTGQQSLARLLQRGTGGRG